MSSSLEGKTIVVTGASSGFGRGAAVKAGNLGANVVFAARRTDLIEEAAKEVTKGQAIAVTTDVSDPEAVAALANSALQRFGKIDVWVNNVGVGALGFFWDIPVEDYSRVIDVNLKGLVYGSHEALCRFIAQGHGNLVNVGSIDSEVPLAYQAVYASTKAAVLSLSRSINQELRLAKHDNIKVGTIMPWAVDTPWWTHAANYTGHAPRMAMMNDPQIVIEAIVKACGDPKEEQPVGPIAQASNISHHLMPDTTERISANIAHREVHKPCWRPCIPEPYTSQ